MEAPNSGEAALGRGGEEGCWTSATGRLGSIQGAVRTRGGPRVPWTWLQGVGRPLATRSLGNVHGGCWLAGEAGKKREVAWGGRKSGRVVATGVDGRWGWLATWGRTDGWAVPLAGGAMAAGRGRWRIGCVGGWLGRHGEERRMAGRGGISRGGGAAGQRRRTPAR